MSYSGGEDHGELHSRTEATPWHRIPPGTTHPALVHSSAEEDEMIDKSEAIKFEGWVGIVCILRRMLDLDPGYVLGRQWLVQSADDLGFVTTDQLSNPPSAVSSAICQRVHTDKGYVFLPRGISGDRYISRASRIEFPDAFGIFTDEFIYSA